MEVSCSARLSECCELRHPPLEGDADEDASEHVLSLIMQLVLLQQRRIYWCGVQACGRPLLSAVEFHSDVGHLPLSAHDVICNDQAMP